MTFYVVAVAVLAFLMGSVGPRAAAGKLWLLGVYALIVLAVLGAPLMWPALGNAMYVVLVVGASATLGRVFAAGSWRWRFGGARHVQ